MRKIIILLSILGIFILPALGQVSRFKMYEPDTIDITVMNPDSLQSDTIFDENSTMYKLGFKEGVEYAKNRLEKSNLLDRLLRDSGMEASVYPDSIYDYGINYEEGFRKGYRETVKPGKFSEGCLGRIIIGLGIAYFITMTAPFWIMLL